jgi:hypothetical protein
MTRLKRLWKTQGASHVLPEVVRARNAAKAKRWRDRNPEAAKAAKQKYYASEKGKAQKRKEDVAYIASGKRAVVEAKRASNPVSEPRKQARLQYQLMRNSSERMLDELSSFTLKEAVHLCRLRKQVTRIDWHVDHIVPVSKGGLSTHSNLQVVPAYWNRAKSNKHTERYFACAS